MVAAAGRVAIFAERVGSEYWFSRRPPRHPVDARAALSHEGFLCLCPKAVGADADQVIE